VADAFRDDDGGIFVDKGLRWGPFHLSGEGRRKEEPREDGLRSPFAARRRDLPLFIGPGERARVR